MSRVLLIDDEASIDEDLVRGLGAHGHDVRTASTGADGLIALRKEVPDVMLVSISLPDITGWELLRRMSPSDRERVPVIIVSASPFAQSRMAEFKPAGVLLEPFPLEALVRLIKEVTLKEKVHA